MKTNWLLLALCCLAPVASAQAQYGYGYGGGYGYSSTAAEGYQHGRADMIRSAGQANLMNSMAAINVQQAASAYMDNRLKWTNTYFEMRRVNREARAAERGPMPTKEQLARIAHEAAPSPLSPGELDPLSGSVNWPVALTADKYKDLRDKIETGLAQRAQRHGAIGYDGFMSLNDTITSMTTMLEGDVRSVPPSQYIYAKNFLKSLGHQIRSPST